MVTTVSALLSSDDAHLEVVHLRRCVSLDLAKHRVRWCHSIVQMLLVYAAVKFIPIRVWASFGSPITGLRTTSMN